uniref:Hemerythrin-like domain-containing protein n=2 Tax=Compsopogon caeruleus TaxID=31354 RepID=A0A7S1XGN0_9RHOD|mmetsp:Transcript_7531/g.15323  ORF Transcript_7531/g.15323 Transcript_7531/m.15323 type:complete len:319 (+) Transcript_7531:102-1058(+)
MGPEVDGETTVESERVVGRGEVGVGGEAVASKAALLNLPRLYIVDSDMTTGWAQEVFSLPHNAIRRELIDLYTILGAVYKRNARTAREEDEKFSHWWSVFSAFVEEYFDIEARILLPLIGPAEEDPVHKQDIAVLMYQMEDARIKLVKKLREVNEVVEKLFVLPMKDVFPLLCKALDHFVPMLLDYFIEEEDVLPSYILGFHSLVMKDVILQKMADFVLVGREPQLFIVMLSAWMDDKEQLSNWKKKALRGYNRFINFQRWESKYLRTHKKIVEDFHGSVLRNSRLRSSRLRSSGLRSRSGLIRSGGLGRRSRGWSRF